MNVREILWRMPLREVAVAGMHALSKFLLLGLGILFGRALGVEGYGIYAYALAMLSVLRVVALAGIPTLVMRDVAVSHRRGQWTEVLLTLRRSYRLAGGLSLTLVIVGISLLILFRDDVAESVWLTNVGALVLLPCTVFLALHGRALRGLNKVLTGQIVETVFRPLSLMLIAGLLFVFLPTMRTPEYAMALQLAVAVLALMISFYLVHRELPDGIVATDHNSGTGRAWVRSALPFTMISFAAVLNSQTDVLMLGWLRSPEEVGLYRVAVQASMLVAFSLQVANIVVAPKVARMYASDQREALQELVTTSARLVLLFALPLAVVFMLMGGEIAAFLFGPEFFGSGAPLVILTVGHVVNAVFGSVGILLNMTGYEKESAKTLWLSTAVNIVLNAIFIPVYGMLGAAVATSASLCIWNVLLFIQVRRRLGINSTAFRKTRKVTQ